VALFAAKIVQTERKTKFLFDFFRGAAYLRLFSKAKLGIFRDMAKF
jgi:hypothetical protein